MHNPQKQSTTRTNTTCCARLTTVVTNTETKNSSKIKFSRFRKPCSLLFVLATLLAPLGLNLQSPTAEAQRLDGYRGIRLPYPAGQSRMVTGGESSHSGSNRRAIDLRMYREPVLAIRSGTVAKVATDQYGGKYILLDHGDNYCSFYLHLEDFRVSLGQQVLQGQQIAISGNTGLGGQYHLHLAVIQKQNGRCTADSSREIRMIFDEKPSGPLQYRDQIVSQNRVGTPSNALFTGNPSSQLTISRPTVDLTVCADNLPLRTVYVQMWRDAAYGNPPKTWNYSKVVPSSSRCVTFSDLDGPYDTFSGVTYYTVASLSQIPSGEAAKRRTSCYLATGRKQLCDSVRR